MYDLLYPSFPRQIAYPHRKTVDSQGFYSTINRLNGKVRVFASIYNFVGDRTVDRINLDLDKIFFDFDGDNALENARALVSYLIMHDYKAMALYSGGGFHVYVFTDDYIALKNKKACLTNVHNWFIRNLNLEVDKTIVGDIARVATIPNTFNTKRKRFCIPITLDDMDKGIDWIKELAVKQRFNFELCGSKCLSIKGFDSDTEMTDCEVEVTESMKKEIDGDELLRKLPLCISSMLANGSEKRVGWRGRFLILCYLRDSGILYGNACEIINKYLSSSKKGSTEARHCLIEEQQGKRIYERDESMFPSCECLKREGYCPVSDICEHAKPGDSGHIQKIYR